MALAKLAGYLLGRDMALEEANAGSLTQTLTQYLEV